MQFLGHQGKIKVMRTSAIKGSAGERTRHIRQEEKIAHELRGEKNRT